MTTEDLTHIKALIEDVETHMKVVAEGHGALAEYLDRLQPRVDLLERRADRVEIHVEVLDKKIDAIDQRLERIEVHLGLGGSPPPGPA